MRTTELSREKRTNQAQAYRATAGAKTWSELAAHQQRMAGYIAPVRGMSNALRQS